MELEKQVCSLELAKRLKELGVKQESVWMWGLYAYRDRIQGDDFETRLILQSPSNKHRSEDWCAAFTVAELGGMMCDGDFDMPILRGTPGRWIAPRGLSADINEVSEADARAQMLIYLIEQRLIEI